MGFGGGGGDVTVRMRPYILDDDRGMMNEFWVELERKSYEYCIRNLGTNHDDGYDDLWDQGVWSLCLFGFWYWQELMSTCTQSLVGCSVLPTGCSGHPSVLVLPCSSVKHSEPYQRHVSECG